MVWKRFVKKKVNGEWKTFGPYYYESYRDKNGGTHSRYLPNYHERRAVTGTSHRIHSVHHGKSVFKRYPILFILLGAIFVIISAVLIADYSLNQESFSIKGVAKDISGFITGFTAENPDEPSGSDTSESASDSVQSSAEEDVSSEETASAESSNIESTNVDATETSPEETPETQTMTEESISAEENQPEQPQENTNIIESVNETSEFVNETEINESELNITETPKITEKGNQSEVGPEIEEGAVGGNITGINISINASETNLTNFTIVNGTNETIVEGNITLETSLKQYGAVLGKPVKWEKRIIVNIGDPGSTQGIELELPKDSGNIVVKKKNSEGEKDILHFVDNEKKIEDVEPNVRKSEEKESENFIPEIFNFLLGFLRGMTGRVVEGEGENVTLDIIEPIYDSDELIVEYETPAPYAIETDITNGKELKIVGPQNIRYENVLAFADLSGSMNIKDPSKVRIYWIEENKFVEPQKIEDENTDGIYDYIEWIVPHLSNQTFRIIVIAKAEHLDENRSFISDIYPEVMELDDIYSEEILDGEYVRVTFERNLTSDRDITIYPKIISGIPIIEVYEINGEELIATFDNLSEGENKVYLSKLAGEQDTFDLKILQGSIEIDYIVDPTGVCSGGMCVFDDTYDLADLRVWEGTRLAADTGFQIMFNISALCDASLTSVDSANLEVYISSITGSPDADYTALFADSTSWTEASSAVTLNGQTTSNSTTSTMSSTTAGTRTNISVTLIVAQACIKGYQNVSIRVYDPDQAVTAIDSVSDSTLIIGDQSGLTPAYYVFSDREDATQGNRPKLYVTYTASSANTAPKWYDNSTNSTHVGSAVLHRVRWTDDTALAGYIFSFDNGTGTYTNDTWVSMIGTGNWSNVTKVINATLGSTIKWRVYSNDSNNAWNVTNEFSYTASNNAPTHNNPTISPYPSVLLTENITCANSSTADSDSDKITNVYNWLVGGSSATLINMPWEINNNSLIFKAVKDYSGNDNNGTLGGGVSGSAPAWTSSGKIGGAYIFDGSDDYILINKSASLNNTGSFAIDLWVKPKTISANGFLFNNYDGTLSAGDLMFYQVNSAVRAYLEGATSVVISSNFLNVDTWAHIAVVVDAGNSLKLYVNGLVNATDSSIGAAPYFDNNNDFRIGSDLTGANLFNGTIDNLRFWNRSLSAEQVYQLYLEGLNNFTNSTILYTETDGGQNWTCEVTPNDAYNDGEKKINSTLVVPSNSPNITLSYPGDGNSLVSTPNVTFQCNATDDLDIVNISLYGNWSGSWHLNQTVQVAGNGNVSYNASFNVSVPDGIYKWNCLAYDNNSQEDWGDANFTFTNDRCGLTEINSGTTLTADNCEHYNITGDDIIFDCAGHKIYGYNSDVYWGVTSDNQDNITIKNCRMEKYKDVIYFENINNSLLENNTLYNNTHVNSTIALSYGVYLLNSTNITIDGLNVTLLHANTTSTDTCTQSAESYAIYIYNSNNTLINNSNFKDIISKYYYDTDTETGGCQGGYDYFGEGIYAATSFFNSGINILNSDFEDVNYYSFYTGKSKDIFVNSSNFSRAKYHVYNPSTSSGKINIYDSLFENASIQTISTLGGTDRLIVNGNTLIGGEEGVYVPSSVTNGVDVIGNKFYNLSGHFIYVNSPSVNITNNYLSGTGSDFSSEYGIYTGASATSPFLKNNTLVNISDGVSASVSLLRAPSLFSDLNISTCYRGVSFATDNSVIWNSTISGCASDFYIPSGIDNVSLYNITFNKSAVDFAGSGSINVYYLFGINVTDQDNDPVDSASINLSNSTNYLIWDSKTTDANGLTDAEWIKEYSQTGDANYIEGCTGSGASIGCATPHNATATKAGYSVNSTNVTINTNKYEHLTIITPMILAYVPVTDVFSIAEPSNQTFSIVHTNTTPIVIRWFVNNTEQTSYINTTQFIWEGNYSQAGFYQIKVNITDQAGAWDEQIWNMTVNNTPASINLDLIYPTSNINVSREDTINVTLNVTCKVADCGVVNVSLVFSENATQEYVLVNSTAGAIPFYLNSSNPSSTSSLSKDQSETFIFWMNATGAVGTIHQFFIYANLTENMSISNQTSKWNITIASEAFSVAIDLSPKLAQQVNWTLTTLPISNLSADGNNGSGISEYWINLSVDGGTADLYMKASGDLQTAGGDILELNEETYSYNSTNNTVPSEVKYIMSTNYADNKIGSSLGDGFLYLKFFLSAPAGQAAGNYNNTLYFKAVKSGESP